MVVQFPIYFNREILKLRLIYVSNVIYQPRAKAQQTVSAESEARRIRTLKWFKHSLYCTSESCLPGHLYLNGKREMSVMKTRAWTAIKKVACDW